MIIFQSIIYKLYDIFAVEPMMAKPSDKDDLKSFRNIGSLKKTRLCMIASKKIFISENIHWGSSYGFQKEENQT